MAVDTALAERLEQGLRDLGLDPARQPCGKYLQYTALLQHWNRAYNLSGIRDPERMISHHVLDALAVLPYLGGGDCLDVGTGAGVPGLILALARADTRWVLLDSNDKKTRFLRHAVSELEAGNVEVIRSRVEDYRPRQRFDCITCRAYGSLSRINEVCRPLLAAHGVILAMKGAEPLRGLDVALRLACHIEVVPLDVPGVETERSLVILSLPR